MADQTLQTALAIARLIVVSLDRSRYHIGLVSRIGNLDKVDQAKAKGHPKPRNLGSVAASVATENGCRVREVEVAKVQQVLREQEAYL